MDQEQEFTIRFSVDDCGQIVVSMSPAETAAPTDNPANVSDTEGYVVAALIIGWLICAFIWTTQILVWSACFWLVVLIFRYPLVMLGAAIVAFWG